MGIIKRDALGPYRPAKVDDEAPAPKRRLRIPTREVQMTRPSSDDDDLSIARTGRVLRRADAQRAAVRYEMVDFEHEPYRPFRRTKRGFEEPEPEGPPISHEALEAAWQVRLSEEVARARAEAYETGYAEGHAAAEAVLQAAFEQQTAQLEADRAQLQVAWQAFVKRSEPLLASLAFDVAGQLLDAPLPQDVRAVSAQALGQAFEAFGNAIPLEITLHPDDYARLQTYGLMDDLAAGHSGLRWNSDPKLAQGDWIVQSPDGAIRRLKEELLAQLKSRFGLSTALKHRDT